MTCLADFEIEKYVQDGIIGITPFEPSLLNPHTYDITLGGHFIVYQPGDPDVALDPLDESTYTKAFTSYEVNAEYGKAVTFPANAFIIGTTRERIRLPDNIFAHIEGKSSNARLAIKNHQTGGFIDAGFEGEITLEMDILLPVALKLTVGMPIGQLRFHVASAARVPYNKKPSSKYMYQCGATTSRYFKNTIR